ncbi:MAG: N-acetylmuramoyl-L-alanine amidase, partial [Melioribacteraceae bacterium]|nr:N-acetylmuramoyl-L-alanine amidase [Melioribacteraceae bacterium]
MGCSNKTDNPLKGKVVCIDPGHGGTAETDSFRVGPTGEREEWINLRVALKLAEMLIEDGAEVILTRSEDESVSLRARAELAINKEADVFVSIHHNA